MNLIERARVMGDHMEKRLKSLQDRHPSIGDVRGMGLFWSVELVKNRKTRLPFNTPEEKLQGKAMMVDRVAGEMLKNGTYVMSWLNCLIIAPPLIVTPEEIDQGIATLDKGLAIADKEVVNVSPG